VPGNDAGRVQPKPAGGKTETLDLGGGVTMEFVRIPAGSFTMGSPQAELDEYKRLYNLTNLGEEQHPVRIGKDFYLGKYPVTQEQYQAVTGTNPSWFSVSGGGKDKVARLDTRRFPVEQVSWEDAVAFCEKLSRPGKRVTLPTEAEWEYACRGGTKTAFYFGAVLNGTQANCDGKVNSLFGTAAKGSSLGRTSRIGSYEKVAPHPWGLCDMHGNVWQWCQDWWDGDYYKRSPNLDPLCRDGEQKYRVLRGGSWFSDGLDCRSGSRSWLGPSVRRDDYGFRVALRLD
jgi:formylglycine-generating enzyme required for sulfatase activity